MKIKSALAAAALLTSGSASAIDGQYFGAQAGFSNIGGFDAGIALIGTYGIPLNSLLPDLQLPEDAKNNLSVEAEITSNILVPPSFDGFGGSFDATATTFGAYGVYTLPVTPELSIRGRAGLLLALISVDLAGFGSASSTDINLTFGGGITYSLSDKMNFIAEYTSLGSSFSNLSAGVQLRF
jgi:opacity protein-like surface antigen